MPFALPVRATALALTAALSLSACVSAPVQSPTSLSSIEGLEDGKSGRTQSKERRDVVELNQVKSVYLHPTRLMTGDNPRYTLTENEKTLVMLEVEAQLCFELSERFEIVTDQTTSDAEVHSAVTWFEPTGTAGSGAAAVAKAFIPGPIGFRLPGSLGGLGAEAEMKRDGKQIAAIVWARRAQAVGTDSPSLSRLGDALQFAEPFGDDAARVMSPEPLPTKRTYTTATDPCLKYGGRINETGFVLDRITGLYVPSDRSKAMEKAKDKKDAADAPQD